MGKDNGLGQARSRLLPTTFVKKTGCATQKTGIYQLVMFF
jgi:hypothetical protein